MIKFLTQLCALWCAFLLPLSWGGSMLLNPYRFAAPGGGGPTLIASDNFDSYADAASLDVQAGWASVNGTLTIDNVGGDGVTFGGGSQPACRRTEVFNANQRAEGRVKLVAPGNAFHFGSVQVRCQSGADTRYFFQTDGSNWYLVGRVAGANDFVLSGTQAIAQGEDIALNVTGTGTGIRLTAQYYTAGAWVDVPSAVSIYPSTAVIEGGTPGMGADSASSAQITMDNFKAYNLP